MTEQEHIANPRANPEPDQGVTQDPSDNTTLTEVLAGYVDSGFAAEFSPLEKSIIACNSCGSSIAANRFTIRSLRRLEGASDPDDMLAVVATACPSCDARGVLVLGYGPMAAAQDADILTSMQDCRAQEPMPDSSPADEPDEPEMSSAMRTADVANGEQP